MELYVPSTIANDLIAISQSFGVEAKVVGYVEPADKKQLTIHSPEGVLTY
jgi:phosphoribosylformylglycinamidine cyclo-ligase